MKKLLIILAVIFMFSSVAEARQSLKCSWIWSTAVTTANDAPDYVFCNDSWIGSWKSKGATYAMPVEGADNIDYQYDTTSAGANVVNGITVCSNTSLDADINFLASMHEGALFDTGTGTAAYYQLNNMTDAVRSSGALTPVGDFMKFTVDGDTNNACVVLRTTVYWK